MRLFHASFNESPCAALRRRRATAVMMRPRRAHVLVLAHVMYVRMSIPTSLATVTCNYMLCDSDFRKPKWTWHFRFPIISAGIKYNDFTVSPFLFHSLSLLFVQPSPERQILSENSRDYEALFNTLLSPSSLLAHPSICWRISLKGLREGTYV